MRKLLPETIGLSVTKLSYNTKNQCFTLKKRNKLRIHTFPWHVQSKVWRCRLVFKHKKQILKHFWSVQGVKFLSHTIHLKTTSLKSSFDCFNDIYKQLFCFPVMFCSSFSVRGFSSSIVCKITLPHVKIIYDFSSASSLLNSKSDGTYRVFGIRNLLKNVNFWQMMSLMCCSRSCILGLDCVFEPWVRCMIFFSIRIKAWENLNPVYRFYFSTSDHISTSIQNISRRFRLWIPTTQSHIELLKKTSMLSQQIWCFKPCIEISSEQLRRFNWHFCNKCDVYVCSSWRSVIISIEMHAFILIKAVIDIV